MTIKFIQINDSFVNVNEIVRLEKIDKAVRVYLTGGSTFVTTQSINQIINDIEIELGQSKRTECA
jgi:DNA-binding LytR/AlgR family response regulator